MRANRRPKLFALFIECKSHLCSLYATPFMYSAIETLAEPHPVSFLVSVLDPRFQEYKKLVRAISLSRDFFNLFFS